jgi:hypothetical protein
MDPYLEAPDIWPDFHDGLAGQLRGELNTTLPAPYYARLEMRPEVGIVDKGESTRRSVPDVSVVRPPQPAAEAGAVAVLDRPRTIIFPSVEVVVHSEPLCHAVVEIRDPTRGHKLITLIEIVSPSSKRPGVDRRTYLQKQKEVLDSDANLIEVDLLRAGDRLLANLSLQDRVAQLGPPPDYLVLVNRAWQRLGDALAFQLFPVSVTEALPCIPVPLRQGQEEVPLDLQFVFNRVYDSGPYRRGAVDYERRIGLPGRFSRFCSTGVNHRQGNTSSFAGNSSIKVNHDPSRESRKGDSKSRCSGRGDCPGRFFLVPMSGSGQSR